MGESSIAFTFPLLSADQRVTASVYPNTVLGHPDQGQLLVGLASGTSRFKHNYKLRQYILQFKKYSLSKDFEVRLWHFILHIPIQLNRLSQYCACYNIVHPRLQIRPPIKYQSIWNILWTLQYFFIIYTLVVYIDHKIYLFAYLYIYLFIYLHRLQHCRGHVTMDSFMSRGHQYMLTISKQTTNFSTSVPGFDLQTKEVGGKHITTAPQ